jgi:hypothetical protein
MTAQRACFHLLPALLLVRLLSVFSGNAHFVTFLLIHRLGKNQMFQLLS